MSDGKEHKLSELVSFCAVYFNLSEEDRKELTKKGSFTKVYDRSQWTGTYFRKAGLTRIISKGKYVITDRGLNLWKKATSNLNKTDLEQYEEFMAFSNGKQNSPLPDPLNLGPYKQEETLTPRELMDNAFIVMNEALAKDLLDTIKQHSARFFEGLVINLLVAMGYGGSFEDAAKVTRYSRDEGIDGIIKEDKLGLDNIYGAS